MAVINDDIEMINLLFRFGINIDFANDEGNTPLHLAISLNKPYSMCGLVELGANEKIENNAGMKSWEFNLSRRAMGCG